MIDPPNPDLDEFPDLLGRSGDAPPQPNCPSWTILNRTILLLAASLAIAYTANWMLDYFHLDPLGIRDVLW
jgi:hypothetical protein